MRKESPPKEKHYHKLGRKWEELPDTNKLDILREVILMLAAYSLPVEHIARREATRRLHTPQKYDIIECDSTDESFCEVMYGGPPSHVV